MCFKILQKESRNYTYNYQSCETQNNFLTYGRSPQNQYINHFHKVITGGGNNRCINDGAELQISTNMLKQI